MDLRHLLKLKSLLTCLLLSNVLRGCEAFQRACSLEKEVLQVTYRKIDHSFHLNIEMHGGSDLDPNEYHHLSARKCTCGHAVNDTYCSVERGENFCIAQWNWGSMQVGDEKNPYVVPRCLKQSKFQSFSMLMWVPICCVILISMVSVITTKVGRYWWYFIMHKGKCFPGINERLIEEMIQTERLRRVIMRDAIESHPQEEREDGMVPKVSLYLKTKTWGGTSGSVTSSSDEESRGTNSINDHASDSERIMCSICMMDIEPGERVGALACKHAFHADCLKTWVLWRNTCPNCNAPDIAKSNVTFVPKSEK